MKIISFYYSKEPFELESVHADPAGLPEDKPWIGWFMARLTQGRMYMTLASSPVASVRRGLKPKR